MNTKTKYFATQIGQGLVEIYKRDIDPFVNGRPTGLMFANRSPAGWMPYFKITSDYADVEIPDYLNKSAHREIHDPEKLSAIADKILTHAAQEINC